MKPDHENTNRKLKTVLIPVDGSPQADEAVRSLQAGIVNLTAEGRNETA